MFKGIFESWRNAASEEFLKQYKFVRPELYYISITVPMTVEALSTSNPTSMLLPIDSSEQCTAFLHSGIDDVGALHAQLVPSVVGFA
jgi:hypothetical protein